MTSMACHRFNVSGISVIPLSWKGKEIAATLEPGLLRVPFVGIYNGYVWDFTPYPSVEKHCCGLSGFGMSLDDVCPACREFSEKSEFMRAVVCILEHEGKLVAEKHEL